MLSNYARHPESSEPKDPNSSSCSSGADRWVNKEEKGNPRRSSGSSSGGSSASDLKRRLQDLPSPNEPALLASRAVNTNRRLSRKRELYFYSATNRIEENDEKDEQEARQSRCGLDSKNSDARTRRRAKIRPGGMQAQTIASQPTSGNNSDEVLSVDETPRNASRRQTSMSKTPSTLSARCDRLPIVNSSRSQKSPPFFRVSSGTASLGSVPSKFGGYRPISSIILQNLSSGSEPSSDYENVTNRISFPPETELRSVPSYTRVSRIPTPREVFNNLDSSRPSTASSYNRVSGMTTPQEVFGNLDSSRNLSAPSGSKISLDESLIPINESPVNDKNRGSSTMSFYKVKDTSRSDCCDTKNSTDKTTNQRMFLSARESLSGYRKQTLEQLSPLEICRSVPAETAPTEVGNYYKEDRYGDESLRSYRKVSSSKESLGNPLYSNFITNADKTASLGTKSSVHSLESVTSKPGFETLKTQYQESLGSPVTRAAFSGGSSAKGSVQSLESVSLKPGFENLKTQYQEHLGSPVSKAMFPGGASARGSVQSLESVSSKPGFENLKTQYQESLGSPVTRAAFSGGASARGSVHSLESVSSKPGFETLKTQYQESLGSPVTRAAFSGGASARGSVHSLESVSSKPGFETLKTQYQESLGSPVTRAAFSGGSSAKGSVHSLESVSSKPGFETLKTQYQESLGSPVTRAAFSGGSSAKGSVHSLESVSSKPGFENLKTQYQEHLGSPVTRAALSGGSSAKGSVQSLESVSSKPGFENLKTQYQEHLGSLVTRAALSGGSSAKGSVQSLESVSSKPGFENLKTQYQEHLGSPVSKATFSGGASARGSVQSLESVSSKPGFENLKTQYQESLGSPVSKATFSGGASARGSVQSLESVSSKPGFETLKTQYQENLGSPVTRAAFSGGSSAKGSVQSLESVSSKPGFENLKTQYQENLESQLSKTSSKCFLDQSEIETTRIPLSTSRIHKRTERPSSSKFRNCSSERNSAISAMLEFHSKDSKKMNEDVLSQDTREYINVPSLALNSQDVSSSSSSLSKTASKKHVNADDLMEALSNASLLETENTYRLSSGTNSGSREIVDALKKSTTSRSHSTKPTESSKSGERVGLDPVSIESIGQTYLKNILGSDSARNFENNKTSSSSRAVDLEKDVASNATKNDTGDNAHKNYENSRDSSSTLLHTDETFKSKPAANKEDLKEDSEDSRSSRSEDKPINRYTTSSNCYETFESLSNDLENSDNFLTKLKSVESTFPMSYQMNYRQSTYEGEVSEKLTERGRLNLLDNQVGDGQDVFVEGATKFESSDSSDDEDLQDKLIEGKIRVSLEKMAAEHFRRNIYAEQARAIQSDTLSFLTEKLYETPFPVTESASTSKLRYSHDSPRFRKKSQDRFPFTMSEKPSVVSHKHPARFDSLIEESKSSERTYKLELHPSITRLAGEGFEETPAEIIDYVSFNEERPPRSGMRGLMRKFSARLKKKKPNGEAVAMTTDVLYENRDYQGDSVVDSCSESSLLKELKVCNSVSRNPRTDKESPDEKSSLVTEKSLIKNESSANILPSASSYRRCDRDNLWVQEIKNPDPNHIEEIKITETPKKTEDKSKKDPYSVFFVKSSQQTLETSARGSLLEEEPKSEISTGKKNKVKFRGSGLAEVVVPKASDENVLRGSIKRRNLEKRKEVGCLCLRFYRMIIPVVRYRSRKSKSSGSLSAKRRPGFSPGKRKG